MRHASLDDPVLRRAIGSSFLDRINPANPEHAPLKIGSDVWTIHQLASDLGVVHTRAARILTDAANAINAKNTRDFYERSTTYSLATEEGLGTTTLYVAWRLFESRDLDPKKWYARGLREAVESFEHFKKREQAANRRTKSGAARRHTGNTAPEPRQVSFTTLKTYKSRLEDLEREQKREKLGLKKSHLRPRSD